jgi:hypothetical protein
MNEPITGKVAAVVDDTTLVISVGSVDGVHEGMLFAIVAEHQEIHDPDSGESLGKWETVKGRVVVTHVQERMSTARSPLVDAEASSTATLSAMMVRHSFGFYGDHASERDRLAVRVGDRSGRPRAEPIGVGDTARAISLEAIAEPPEEPSQEPITPDLPSETYEASPGGEPEADD